MLFYWLFIQHSMWRIFDNRQIALVQCFFAFATTAKRTSVVADGIKTRS